MCTLFEDNERKPLINRQTDSQQEGKMPSLLRWGLGGGIKMYEMFEITRCLSYQSSKEYLLT